MRLRKHNRNRRLYRRHLKGRNLHHNIARARGGSNENWNLILLKIEKHDLLHRVFGLRTLKEIIAILERLDRMKEKQKRH